MNTIQLFQNAMRRMIEDKKTILWIGFSLFILSVFLSDTGYASDTLKSIDSTLGEVGSLLKGKVVRLAETLGIIIGGVFAFSKGGWTAAMGVIFTALSILFVVEYIWAGAT